MELRILFFGILGTFIITTFIEPFFIPFLRWLKFGQTIRDEGPESHHQKAGTPTMGGSVFVLGAMVTFFIGLNAMKDYFDYSLYDILILILPFLIFAIIGFVDDLMIVINKSNKGLSGRVRLLLQLLVSCYFFYLYIELDLSTNIHIFGADIDLVWLYGFLIFFVLVGSANGVNLTDGLDGLAAGTSAFALGAFTFIAIYQQQFLVAFFTACVIGGILGFLLFNTNPAKVFMGDTGSLALGACLGTVAILTKHELLLILIGGIFVVETLSVILQVWYFKRTGGKRIFKMTPIHHHFELSGMKESSIVLMFWIIGFMLAIVGMLIAT